MANKTTADIQNLRGKIGIGTNNPLDTLHVNGTFRIGSGALEDDIFNIHQDSSSGIITTYRNNTGGVINRIYADYDNDGTIVEYQERVGWNGNYSEIGNYTNHPLYIHTNNATRMTISSSGNVGIGTTDPSCKLEVKGASGTLYDTQLRIVASEETGAADTGGSLSFVGHDGNAARTHGAVRGRKENSTVGDYGGYLAFDTRANNAALSEKMRILGNGNVGIGKTDPSAPLHINGGSTNQVIKIQSNSAPYIRFKEGGTDVGFIQFGTDTYISNQKDGTLNFRTNNTDKMTILSSGNVGIGTTNPTRDLHIVKSNDGGQVRFQIINTSNTADSTSVISIYNGGADGGDPFLHWKIDAQQDWSMGIDNSDADKLKISKNFGPGTNDYLTVDTSGNVGIGTTHPDKRLDIKLTDTSSGTYYAQTVGGSNHLTGYAVGIGFDPEGYGNRNKVGIIVEGTGNGWSTGHMHFVSKSDTGTGSADEATIANARMTIASGGNVGIGVTGPSEILQIKSGRADILLESTTAGQATRYRLKTTSREWRIGTNSPKSDAFWIYDGDASSYRLEISTSGQLKLPAYGGGSFKGNGIYGLGVDSSGNVVETSGTYFGTNTSNTYTNQWHNFLELSYSTYGSLAIKIHLRGHGNTSAQSLVGEIEFNFKNQNGTIRSRATVNSYGTTPISKDDIAIYYDTTNSKINFYWKVKENYTSPQYYIDGYVFNYIWKNTYIGDDTDLASETNDSITSNLKFQGIVQDQDSGLVGIGTSAPNTRLSVDGDLSFLDSNGTTRLTVGNVTTSSPFESKIYTGNYHLVLQAQGSGQGDIKFRTGTTSASDRMIINSSGNVGIGTTSPKAHLHINDGGTYNNTDANNRLFIERDDHAYILMSTPDDKDQGIHFHNTTDNALVGRIAYKHRSTGDTLSFRVGSSNNTNEFFILNSDGTIQIKGYGAGILTTDASGNISTSSAVATSSTLDDVTDNGNSTTNSIVVGGVGSSGEIALYSTGTADATNTEYHSHPLRFSTSGWDTNNSVARNVHWNIRSESASNIFPDAYLTFYEENISYDHWKLKLPGRGSGSSYIHPDAALFNGNVVLYESDTTDIRIKFVPDGDSYFTNNLGIGTTSPDAPLTVHNSTDPEIRFGYSSSQDHRIVWDSSKVYIHADPENANASSAIGLGVDGTIGLFMDNEHDVGIGTTSPNTRLHVADSTTGVIMRIQNSSAGEESSLRFQALSSTSTQEYADIALDPQSGDGALVFRNPYTSERMRITGGGNVGIGTDSPSAKLHITGDFENGKAIVIEGTYGTDTTHYIRTHGVNSEELAFYSGTAKPLAIDTSGRIKVNNAFYLPTADGSSGQVMTTNGSGTLSWSNVTSSDTLDDVTDNGNSTTNSIVLGASTTGGTMLVRGTYTSGNIVVIGGMKSSGGAMIGYGVKPDTATNHGFVSSSAFTLERSAYYQQGNRHRWYAGASQDVAIGNAVTMSETMRLDFDKLGLSTSSPASLIHLGKPTNGSNIITFGEASIGGPHGLDFYGDDATRTKKYSIYYRTGTENISMETSDGTKRFEINQSGAVTLNEAFTFPTADGSAGAALVTNGSGSLSWNAGYQQYTPVGWGVLNNQTYTSTGSNISSNSVQAQAGTTPVQRNSATEFEATKAGWYEISYSFIVKNNYTNRAMIGAYMTASSSGGGGVIPGSHSTQYVRYSTYGEYAQIQNTFYYYTSYSSTNFYLLAYLLSGSMNMTTQAVSQSMISFRYINNDIT